MYVYVQRVYYLCLTPTVFAPVYFLWLSSSTACLLPMPHTNCVCTCLFSVFQEVRVRFSGFGAEEDEWINVRKCVRQRSLQCEATECVAVLPGDLILCFQVLSS
jgi:hypothetical protein